MCVSNIPERSLSTLTQPPRTNCDKQKFSISQSSLDAAPPARRRLKPVDGAIPHPFLTPQNEHDRQPPTTGLVLLIKAPRQDRHVNNVFRCALFRHERM